jgi:hypothetical protein
VMTASARLPLLIVCVVLAGCAARKPVVSNISHTPSYRLESQNGVSLLLSPNIPAQQPPGAPISFTLLANRETSAASQACTATEGDFRMEPATNDPKVRIVLPPIEKWLFGSANSSGADENNTIDSLYAFLAAIDRAQNAGCFSTEEIPARDYIMQSIPTRPSDSLFNAYGYRIERSGVNLKPNLRLKVERAYFSSTERSDKNYIGLSNVFFDVATNSDASIRFQQTQPIHYSPDSLAQTDREGSRDLAIPGLKPRKHYRVLFYAHHVPTDQSFTAALIGSDDSDRLDQFEQTMRADANASCASSTHDDIQCLEFRGFVTVTVQLLIELNGQPKFVDWSTEVKDVLPEKFPESLKIQRQFANTYFPVIFNPDEPDILHLTLVGADRLSW